MDRLSTGTPVIDVWLARYQQVAAEDIDRLRGLLSREERAQALRFHFADDARRHVVTRALVRTVLSRYADVTPRAWTFDHNRFGRPEVSAVHGEASELRFNVSHTRGLIALGVCRQRALGIDVENVAVRQLPTSIARRYFAPAEIASIEATPEDKLQQRMFEYWTLKEAYIKARGIGLSLPLDGFAFDLGVPGRLQVTMTAELNDTPERWWFGQYQITPRFVLAICWERDRHAPALRFHHPLDPRDCVAHEIDPLRRSEGATPSYVALEEARLK